MERTPAVSVLMTSYNRADYIGAAIESVLAQWFDDFELLIVDNGSTDDTIAIARGYESRDPRVRVHVNERNLGQFGNRNRAAELARAPLFRYLDSDDLMYPHCLAVCVPPMQREPRAAIGITPPKDWPGGPCPMLLTPRMMYQREFLSMERPMLVGPGCGVFRREEFLAVGGYDDRGMPSDNLFWLKACARYDTLALPAGVFWYRVHPGQLLQSDRAALEYTIVAGERLRALDAPECPLTAEEREEAKRGVLVQLAREIAADIRAGKRHLARERLRHAGLSLAGLARRLRRPRRSLLIGTPLDERGEYIVPDWAVYASPAVRSSAGGAHDAAI